MISNSGTGKKYILGSKTVVGDPRRKWEDRVFVGIINRESSSPIIVGIVADGVGSADYGARGAQLAVDTVVESLRRSDGDDISSLIEKAITKANETVYRDNQSNDGDALTTIIICVIHNDRLYIGNVGDSQAYIVFSQNKISQISKDHTFYNVYGGKSSAPSAGVLVNAIGRKAEVFADTGIYISDRYSKNANEMGRFGIPFKLGDAVVLCSDGLTKVSYNGLPYISKEEIVEAIRSKYETDMAAILIVGKAEGRRPDDNVSAVTIQYLNNEIENHMKSRANVAQRTRNLFSFSLWGIIIIILIVVVLVFILR